MFKNEARYRRAYDAARAECPPADAVLDVATEFGSTRVYRFGEGEPMVLLPGLSATALSWAPFIPAFAARHRVYAIDTMGEAGMSVATVRMRSARDRVRWLDGVLGELDLTGVHLVGASSGGCYVAHQAVHAPERLARIALIDPTTVAVGFSAKVLLYGMVAGLLDRDAVWRRFLRWSADADVLDRADVQLVLAGIRDFGARIPPQLPRSGRSCGRSACRSSPSTPPTASSTTPGARPSAPAR
ncbi:alpha/beta fold hydrolase [Actinokineospora soli]|uniref:Alpha/beta fold hydrolase n=1 Tax=Actinokineospora soli TaxID=1048753 RepID=A0ABW2TSN7_9PSEU